MITYTIKLKKKKNEKKALFEIYCVFYEIKSAFIIVSVK